MAQATPTMTGLEEATQRFGREIDSRIREAARQEVESLVEGLQERVLKAIGRTFDELLESQTLHGYIQKVAGQKTEEALRSSRKLEAAVSREVDRKLEKAPGPASPVPKEELRKVAAEAVLRALKEGKQVSAGGSGGIAPEELKKLVEAEVRQCLGSEQMKVLIDDKFRTISLYLKTDVIPKVVRKTLKEDGK